MDDVAERRDLDPADLDEVRRRVVEPVLAAMFESGELTDVSLFFGRPRDAWSPYGHGDDGAWLTLRVGSERFIHPVEKAGFWLVDANHVAGNLESSLTEWICESRFGWGQVRVLPNDWRPRPARASTVSIHFADGDDGFPVWADGEHASWIEARLSSELTAELRAWQALGAHFSAQAEAGAADAVPAREARRQWIDALEPWRDELVERLRAELGPDHNVSTPPRVV